MQGFLIEKLHYILMYITSRVCCGAQHRSHTYLLLTPFGGPWMISRNPIRHGRRPLTGSSAELGGAVLRCLSQNPGRAALLCRRTHSEETCHETCHSSRRRGHCGDRNHVASACTRAAQRNTGPSRGWHGNHGV